MSPEPLKLQAINDIVATETIGLSREEAEQIIEAIRDLRERVKHKQAAMGPAETPDDPTGFIATLRNAFGGT